MNADTTEVLAVLDRLYQAWKANDADGFVHEYLDDATVVMPGTLHQGRTAVRDAMKAGFAGPLAGSTAWEEPQDIRVVDGSTAIVVSHAGFLMPGETEVPQERRKLATWVLCKRAAGWRIAAYTNTPLAS